MNRIFKQAIKMCAMDIKYLMADFQFIITYHGKCYMYNYENLTFKPVNENSNKWFDLNDMLSSNSYIHAKVSHRSIRGLTKFIESICNNIKTCEDHGIKNRITSFYTYEGKVVVIDFNEIEEHMNGLKTSEVNRDFLAAFDVIETMEMEYNEIMEKLRSDLESEKDVNSNI